jgi:hypothetical protein
VVVLIIKGIKELFFICRVVHGQDVSFKAMRDKGNLQDAVI